MSWLVWLLGILVFQCTVPCGMRHTRCGRELFADVERGRTDHLMFDFSTVTNPGPETHKERLLWMDWLWDHLAADQKDRMVRNLSILKLSSAFSGVGGMELVMFLLVWMVNRKIPNPLPYIRSTEAGDCCQSRRDVLKSLWQWARPLHITKHFNDRLQLVAAT